LNKENPLKAIEYYRRVREELESLEGSELGSSKDLLTRSRLGIVVGVLLSFLIFMLWRNSKDKK
jgi:hypothetical protein